MRKNQKRITLTGKAADQAFRQKLAEIGIKRVGYSVYPLRDGYKRVGYSLDGKQRPLNYTMERDEDPLNQEQKEFVLFFTNGVWDMGRLSAFLQQHCNVTDPSGLTWKKIFDHLIVLAQAKHITVETINKYPSMTFSGQTRVLDPGDLAGQTIEGEWLKPMTKSRMRKTLRMDGDKAFNTFAEHCGIRPAGNRQLWQIRLDTMDPTTRKKLEKA
jgi:phage-related protein